MLKFALSITPTLKFELTPRRNPKAKPQGETPRRNPKAKPQGETPRRNPKAKPQRETPTRNPNAKPQRETPTRNPNACRWNIGCVGCATREAGVGHVHFMFFVLISFALGIQSKPSFQWNMGLTQTLSVRWGRFTAH